MAEGKVTVEERQYIPLSERLNQDVWHDNFVPKYSAIPAARPSRVVLIGVWLIFAPMALVYLAIWLANLQEPTDVVGKVLSSIGVLFMLSVSIAILYQQTRRYLRARRHPGPDADVAADAAEAGDA